MSEVGAPQTVPWNVSPCLVHGYHWPRPLETVRHHVWPLGMGGPDAPHNIVMICDTGHRNVHHLLTLLIKGKPIPRKAHRNEIAIAGRGFATWVAAGKPMRSDM